jgi:signal transduction histidine kinase/AmiR/NasT family two-component response regulator
MRTRLRQWLALPRGGDGLPVSAAELERGVQRRMHHFATAFVAAMLLMYGGLTIARGNPPEVWMVLGIVALGVGWDVVRTRRDGDHGKGLLRMHTALFVGVLAGALLRLDVNSAAFWWLTVVPFVTILGGHLRAGLTMGAIVVAYTVMSFASPYAVVADDDFRTFRLHLAVGLSTVYACAFLALATLWRRQLQQALERTRHEALAAAAAKAQFLANMSHEIRTPLAGVIGAAELLKGEAVGDAQRTQIAALQVQSAKALLALVNDVLDWSKLEAGKVVLEDEPVNLRALVFEASELFAVAAFDKGLELTSSCDPGVPRRLRGDATRIRQVLHNLVGNAVKFTHGGGVHLHLALAADEPAEPGRQALRMSVSDSGIGIDPARLATLFGAFEQADASVTRRYGGTGLGLAISRELARLMGGRIDVHSTLGEGSTFSMVLALPVVDGPDEAAPAPARPDVLLACASDGLMRHLHALLRELRVEPHCSAALPDDAALVGRRIVIVDARLLGAASDARAWLARLAARGLRTIVVAPLNADAVVGTLPGALLIYKPVRREALRAVLAAAESAPPETIDAAPAPAPATAAVAKAAVAAGATTPARALGGLRVLLCEDNPVNQVIVQAMLAQLGAQATIAANGVEALARLGEGGHDLVLMDLQMPELDGIAAATRWRAIEAGAGVPPEARVPIVAVTANSEGDEGAACRAAGMDGFLAKPFGIAALRQCLAAHARRSGALAEAD